MGTFLKTLSTTDRINHLEKWISAIGGLISLFGIVWVSHTQLGMNGAATLIASMGASAVLLFATPHSPTSQPWAVLGGHTISALIGVTCSIWIKDLTISAAIAVALSIAIMHYSQCLHPPGGATALTAIIGGESIHQLGYTFVITPVLLNVITILLIAFIFNYPFVWRRYPLALFQKQHT